jgi:L-2-hydroxyglutarate oxidase LhgO
LKLKNLFRNAKENGVSELSYLNKREILALEPEIEADEAIFSGTSGIVDSHGFMRALADDFETNNGIIMQKTSFSAAEIGNEKINVEIKNADQSTFTFTTGTLINASGLSSSYNSKKIIGKSLPDIPETIPCKGNYFYYSGKNPFSHLVYPLPDQDGLGLGIHASIDLGGKLKFGPDVDLGNTSLEVNPKRKKFFLERIRNYWPNISEEKLVPDYVGLRPKIFIENKIYNDFLIQEDTANRTRLISLYGIESPGLTSSLSLAQKISSKIN